MPHYDYRNYRIYQKGKEFPTPRTMTEAQWNEDVPTPEETMSPEGFVVVGTLGMYRGANVMPGAGCFESISGAKEAIDILLEAGANQTTGCDSKEEFEHQKTVGRRFMELMTHTQALYEDAYRSREKAYKAALALVDKKVGDKVRAKNDIHLQSGDVLRPQYEYTISEAQVIPVSETEFALCIRIGERPNLNWLLGELFNKSA